MKGRKPTGKTLRKRTRAVHAGTRRSQYGEVSEAIFLTQGFVYDTAEAAEARFIETGPDEYIYARYGNPTVRMFEDSHSPRWEGAEDCLCHGLGHGGGERRAGVDAEGGRSRRGRRALCSDRASTSSRRC